MWQKFSNGEIQRGYRFGAEFLIKEQDKTSDLEVTEMEELKLWR
jgi:hypothetical protein